jgi:hypothetical protein
MKSRLYKMVAGAAALLALIPSASAVPSAANGVNIAPDGGASIVLLALGCSGLAVAARRFFKR